MKRLNREHAHDRFDLLVTKPHAAMKRLNSVPWNRLTERAKKPKKENRK